jgi:hypothetical protein
MRQVIARLGALLGLVRQVVARVDGWGIPCRNSRAKVLGARRRTAAICRSD